MSYTCQYCKKTYVKESTLISHLCESKRRWQQEKEQGVQLGFKAYLRFYEISQGSSKLKSYSDFVESSFYTAFVKFGRHLVAIRAVNTSSFIEWLLKNNKKLDNWTSDKLYLEWLQQYIRKESVQDALERALKEMQEYADHSEKLQSNFKNYFRLGSSNRICHHISNGRISPWILFNCRSGIEFLEKLNEEQLANVMPWIDPEFWNQKFKDYATDTQWVKEILDQAQL